MYRAASTCTERKSKKNGKPLTRLTSHVSRKKKKVTFYFPSYLALCTCTCTRTLTFFFSGMGNCALALPGGGGWVFFR